ncbi:hypothetical protein GGR51DRAFT_541796 [Nemania sp. FL0031]|nr:hypothetical protein GGR51DRAFT_541796 [Nemania sp. FL0031]
MISKVIRKVGWYRPYENLLGLTPRWLRLNEPDDSLGCFRPIQKRQRVFPTSFVRTLVSLYLGSSIFVSMPSMYPIFGCCSKHDLPFRHPIAMPRIALDPRPEPCAREEYRALSIISKRAWFGLYRCQRVLFMPLLPSRPIPAGRPRGTACLIGI